MERNELRSFLDAKADLYNRPAFIEKDPLSIPHRFAQKEDIEISAFFSATLAWGQRVSIIRSAEKLMQAMDWAPHQFILQYRESDLQTLSSFVHRTFQFTDLQHFCSALQRIYLHHGGLEQALATRPEENEVGPALNRFHRLFFDQPHARRSQKHLAHPGRNSACKRLNMFLRWMVRQDSRGCDFGLWTGIRPHQLSCPLDVHTGRVARSLGLLQRPANDWKAVRELDTHLRQLDPDDPVRYDYALFGLGIYEKWG